MLVSSMRLALLLPLLAWMTACSGAVGGESGGETTGTSDEALDQEALAGVTSQPFKSLFESAVPGQARCFTKIRTDASGNVQNSPGPQGLTPADLQSAYKIPSSTKRYTIAIIDANDNPGVLNDLAVYRAQFGLPPCTEADDCFRKVNQNGVAGQYPYPDPDWSTEIILDVSMASAACPSCKILLVEANSPTVEDMGTAVNTAVRLGASVVSNSYGFPETTENSTYDKEFFDHPGVAIFASTGDSGYGTQYPASGYSIISVGGTTLVKSASSRGWAEKAWAGAGSGCSGFTAKPPWQTDSGCDKKMTADVSATADIDAGVAIYDTEGDETNGWIVIGGTSAATPLVAAIFAATGHADVGGPSVWKRDSTDFFDVTSGSNGKCKTNYFCTAGIGYDGPTGWGTPNGAGLASW
jgi:subtilase family serine protease